MGKLPPWGSLPIDGGGGVGWAIIMILFVSVPVEGLLKKILLPMPQVNLLLVTIWLEAWGQVGCAR